jgi:DNA-binding PadR family transcriptional regulator
LTSVVSSLIFVIVYSDWRSIISTRLVILGLLRDRPLHGYEIKHIIEEHMDDWTSIAFGSIYFALKKLSEEGLVEVAATERTGNRPSRTVYALTQVGREEFLRLLRKLWSKTERQYFATDLGLFFMDALSPKEILEHLQARLDDLNRTAEHLKRHRAENMTDPHVPRRARFIFDHSQAHLEAELSWTQALWTELHDGGSPDAWQNPG